MRRERRATILDGARTRKSPVAVYGWTEAGSEVIVNGKNLPVGENGLFMEHFLMSPQVTEINLRVNNSFGTKEIIRSFDILF